jgi:exopolyphosphatase/guanosine-5'-triphosphate,3'-diphosphate pyrophosphatase
MQRIAVIDLGSNTTRMIVMEYTAGHSFRLLDEVRESVRLAEGIGSDGALTPAAMERGIATMALFCSLCRASGVDFVVPVATSAVREASNQLTFLAAVEVRAGLQLQVLSANEEAYYGYLGVVNSLDIAHGAVIDIGGGSTQISRVDGRVATRSFSQPIGALRLASRHVQADPISRSAFAALCDAIEEQFAPLDWLAVAPGERLAGVGGTIRALGELDMRRREYPLDRVHGYVLERDRLEDLIELLRVSSRRQREQLPGVNRDRADLMLPGALIVAYLMRRAGATSLQVGGCGLREGLFYAHFLADQPRPLFEDMRRFSVVNLARLSQYEASHAQHVAHLALLLFDQLAALHGYGAWERELLEHAATLHDIGLAVSYYDHHRHGAYLILNAALQGFSHREVALLALLVRFHRKGDVDVGALRGVLAPGDERRVARLAALLRLAEYLERRKSQVVGGLHVTLGDPVLVQTHTMADATVEIWDANRGAGLFRSAYGCDVRIV